MLDLENIFRFNRRSRRARRIVFRREGNKKFRLEQLIENHLRQDISQEDTECRLKLSFSVLEEAQGLINEAKQILSSKLPRGASLEDLFTAGLNSIVDEHKRKTKALGSKAGRGSKKRTRHIPAKVKRAVLKRDGHQCTFVGESGKVCGCKWNLEIDHIKAFAEGGEHTVENLRVLCREHNQYLAVKKFGRVWEVAA